MVSSAAGVSGPGSAGGPGPQQQTQLVGPGQSGLLQQQQQDFDPVQRYKMLIPQLKESLQVMNRTAGSERGLAGDRGDAQSVAGEIDREAKLDLLSMCLSNQSEALSSRS